MTIDGIKLISHNMGGVNNPDDPSYPFVLDANLRIGDMFMAVAASFIYGSERVKVRGMSMEALREFAGMNFKGHPRLSTCTVTGPDGAVTDLRAEWAGGGGR